MIASTIGYPILMGLFLSLSLIGLPKVSFSVSVCLLL